MNFNQFQINPKAIIFHCVSAEGGGALSTQKWLKSCLLICCCLNLEKKLLFAFELKIAVSFIVLRFLSFILAAFETFKFNIFCKIL